MADRHRMSAGVVRRNERLTALRQMVPLDAAIVAVDLASERQAVVIADHDSRVLERRMVIGSPWKVLTVLAWAKRVALEHGFARIVLACEPTGRACQVLCVWVLVMASVASHFWLVIAVRVLRPLRTLSRIDCALAVQTRGFGSSLLACR